MRTFCRILVRAAVVHSQGIKIDCDGDDKGDDGGDVGHPEAFASALFAMFACFSAGFRRSQAVSWRDARKRACVLLLAPSHRWLLGVLQGGQSVLKHNVHGEDMTGTCPAQLRIQS